jgi:hypothetical protein
LWIIIGAGLVLAAAAVTLFVAPFSLAERLAGGFDDLADGAAFHPDGLAVMPCEDTGGQRVRLTTVPRAAFLEDAAGEDWASARMAIPASLIPLSPIYTVEVRGEGCLVGEMAVPNGAEPLSRLSLYAYKPETGQWEFVPSEIDTARQTILFAIPSPSMSIMAFHVEPGETQIGLVISPGASVPSVVFDLALLEGVIVDGEGGVQGVASPVPGKPTLLIVANREGAVTSYEGSMMGSLLASLTGVSGSYQGLALDFTPAPGYPDLVAGLAANLHSRGLELDLIMRDGDLPVDDLPGLAQFADRIWLAPGGQPELYLPGGPLSGMLDTLAGAVSRQQVGLLVSGLSVEVVSGAVRDIGIEDAATPLGQVAAVEGYLLEDSQIRAGMALPLVLSGSVTAMGFDVPSGMNYLVYSDASGAAHFLYLGSAQNLLQKMGWASSYGLGAVAVRGLAHVDAPEGLVAGLMAFQTGQPVEAPPPLGLVWRIADTTGSMVDETGGDLALAQFLWESTSLPGQYRISAYFQTGEREFSLGELAVEVIEAELTEVEYPEATATPAPTVVAAGPRPTPTAAPASGAPPPVSGVIVGGSFELGGQTHTLAHPGQMGQAGMSWVKFQYKWSEGATPGAVAGQINMGHANGFKVLLSIPGPEYPSSINFQAYIDFLAGVASLGPDAIEVWNEMNLNREWPTGQINGQSYVVNMLAPAFNAIKSVNPGIMVISGAPAPTGYWGACAPEGCDDWLYIQQMRDAGAASYMDCMGIHYNEGIIPPSQRTGDPRSEHYTRYFFGMLDLYYGTIGRPVCFTELGYLSPEGYGALPSNFAWAADTTVAEQAAWLREAAVLASQSGKVRLMIIFNVDFTVWGEWDPQAGYAMIRPDGSCPACDALAGAW